MTGRPEGSGRVGADTSVWASGYDDRQMGAVPTLLQIRP